jgi:hypothetical protein
MERFPVRAVALSTSLSSPSLSKAGSRHLDHVLGGLARYSPPGGPHPQKGCKESSVPCSVTEQLLAIRSVLVIGGG